MDKRFCVVSKSPPYVSFSPHIQSLLGYTPFQAGSKYNLLSQLCYGRPDSHTFLLEPIANWTHDQEAFQLALATADQRVQPVVMRIETNQSLPNAFSIMASHSEAQLLCDPVFGSGSPMAIVSAIPEYAICTASASFRSLFEASATTGLCGRPLASLCGTCSVVSDWTQLLELAANGRKAEGLVCARSAMGADTACRLRCAALATEVNQRIRLIAVALAPVLPPAPPPASAAPALAGASAPSAALPSAGSALRSTCPPPPSDTTGRSPARQAVPCIDDLPVPAAAPPAAAPPTVAAAAHCDGSPAAAERPSPPPARAEGSSSKEHPAAAPHRPPGGLRPRGRPRGRPLREGGPAAVRLVDEAYVRRLQRRHRGILRGGGAARAIPRGRAA